jgi:hypothetical protein
MKNSVALAALLASAIGVFGQGAITFNNRNTTAGSGGAAPVVAPIFGMDPADPTAEKQGNPAANWNGTSGPTPVPLGTQVYGGTPLNGSGFTAQLWAADSQAPDSAMAAIATTSFRRTTLLSFQGFLLPLATSPVVPGVASDAASRAKFQLRVWDNKGGTITSWQQLIDPASGVVARGWSTIFTVPFQLGAGTTTPPHLIGLESFQLFVVPEPSVIALGALGAGCLLLLRRRK